MSGLPHRGYSFHSVGIHGGGDLTLTLKHAVAKKGGLWLGLPLFVGYSLGYGGVVKIAKVGKEGGCGS